MTLPKSHARSGRVVVGAFLIASVATEVSAAPAAPGGGREYQGPQTAEPPNAPADPDTGPDADSATPDTDVDVEPESPDPIEPSPTPEPAAPQPATPEPDPGFADDDGFDGFELVDLTEDEEALRKELAVETVKVEGHSGTVKGRVLDQTTGEPLIGAYVEAIGTKYRTKTDVEGRFELPLPVGAHELRVRYDTFEPRRISGVVVSAGGSATVNTELRPLEGASQRVVVEAEMNRESEGARLLQRKESVGTHDIMSRDEIEKSGGGSTASVAGRIVGATIVNGKYLFVRGLGHRYGNTLLDGARLSSPDPDLRTVQLDIIPAGGLSAINVRKTFTPDMPGDFAGGSTNLETRDIPRETIFKIDLSLGANTATTGRTGVTHDRYPGYDAFGFGYIPLGLPSRFPRDRVVDLRLQDDQLNSVWTPEEIEDFGNSLHTKTRVLERRMPVNFGGNMTVGHTFRPGNTDLGFITGLTYKNEWHTLRDTYQAMYNLSSTGGALEKQLEFEGPQTDHRVAWGAINVIKWKLDRNNRLESSTLYTHDSEDRVAVFDGFSISTASDSSIPVKVTRNRYTARALLLTRLGGSHKIPKAKDFTVDWFGAYTRARNHAPMRDMVFRDDANDGVFRAHENNSGLFLFPEFTDHVGNGAANFTMPFKQWSKLDARVKAGAWVEGRNREFVARRFRYESVSGITPPAGTGNILNPDTIGGGATDPAMRPFILRENTRPEDSYDGRQQVYAGYAMLDLPLVRWLKVSGGARFEASNIAVEPYDFTNPDREFADEQRARLRDRDWLPAAALIFSPRSDMNIRVGGSKTLARPEFRELAPFLFPQYTIGLSMAGNPTLQSTSIWNADLRWEWFPSANEVVAAGLFYKYFDDPIELVMLNQGAQGLMTYNNAEFAHNIGAEVELRKNLEFLAPERAGASEDARERRKNVRRALADLSVGVNAAYIHSVVELGVACVDEATREECLAMGGSLDASTSRSRPLMDQSPFVINSFISYDNERSGTRARLLYHTFGRRVHAVGIAGLPDVYMEPLHRLDLVASQRVWKSKKQGHELTIHAGARNLLDWQFLYTQGDQPWMRWREGITFTVGAGFAL
mgnify:CR=1 FL=1